MHRSSSKTLPEKLFRRMSSRKKYRCRKCDRAVWIPPDAPSEASRQHARAEARRRSKDPIARRSLRRRWRNGVLVAFIALFSGLTLGVMVARWQESQATSPPAEP